jgi:hypothetical protein
VASVTSWTRLEPHPLDGSMARSLQGQVRDPAWMLARQWQLGEFAGADAGSPVQAVLSVSTQPLTGYTPNAPGGAGAVEAYDPGLPLEAHVERVPVTLNVRGSAQLGVYAENAITALGLSAADQATVLAALRTAYPIAATVPPDAAEDAQGRLMRATLAGRVVDGVALAAALAAAQAGGPPLPAPITSVAGVSDALTALAAYRGSLYSEPAGDDAWQPRRLGYAASVTATTAATGTVTLAAQDFPGGGLDWYSFSLADPGQGAPAPAPVPSPPAPPAPQAPQTAVVTFLPTHVAFRGSPPQRWWEFEDAAHDFGAVAPDTTDLATMLVTEFALVYGNDWFQVPVPAAAGSLARVDLLVATDTFGVRTVIEPVEQLTPAAGGAGAARPWSMFKVTGGSDPATGGSARRSPFILLAPSCGAVMEAAPLEEVFFLRDDMAALAWAVQDQVQGPMDAPVDGLQLAFEHDAALPPPALPQDASSPTQAYVLETVVPDNWIPMVPVVAPGGARYFRRGVMVRPGYGDITPTAHLLTPGTPLFVADEAVPSEGADVTRGFRRIRWSDGSTVLWLAQRNRPGRGPGWSGLAYDLVVPLRDPTA